MKKWKIEGTIAAIIITTTLGLTYYTVNVTKRNASKNKAGTTESDTKSDAELDAEKEYQQQLMDKITELYNNNQPKYYLNELLAGVSVGLPSEELENIFGGTYPTTKEMLETLQKFYTKAYYEYTYATKNSGYAAFVENESEKVLLVNLENTLASIKNNGLNQTDVAKGKAIIDQIYSGDYSAEFKSYIFNTIFPTFKVAIGTVEFKYTDEEATKFVGLEIDYMCDAIAIYGVNRDQALKINGTENGYYSNIPKLVDQYLVGDNFVNTLTLKMQMLSSYNPVDVDTLKPNDRTVSDNSVTASPSSTNENTDSSSNDKTNEEGTTVDKKDLSKEDKAKADAGEDKVDAKLDLQNKWMAQVLDDVAVANQEYVDAINKYVQDRVAKSGKDDDYDMSYIKNDLFNKTLEKWTKEASYKKRYKKLDPKYSEYDSYCERFYNGMDSFRITTSVDYKQTRITIVKATVINAVKNGLVIYSQNNPALYNPANVGDGSTQPEITVVPGTPGQEYWNDVEVGPPISSTDYSVDENGNLTPIPTPAPTSTPTAPSLDLTGDQSTYTYTNK